MEESEACCKFLYEKKLTRRRRSIYYINFKLFLLLKYSFCGFAFYKLMFWQNVYFFYLQEQTDDEPSLREPSEKGWSETLGSVSKDNSPDQDISEDSAPAPPPPPIVTTPVGKSHTKRYIFFILILY